MHNLQKAEELLYSNDYTCVVCRGDTIYSSYRRGVAPLYIWLREGMDFEGFSAADKVVGKATAFLYIHLNIKSIFAKVISKSALKLLTGYNISVKYDMLTENIINRKGDGICPFEESVLGTDDITQALVIINNKYKELIAMSDLSKNIKKLGFGMMRLPKIDGEPDMEQIREMVDYYMDSGFTYFDTAWAYTGNEEIVKKVLVERYPRESFQLATKCASWITKDREKTINQFEESLANTGAGYFDFYLLHNLGGERTAYADKFGLWEFVKEKKRQGLIKHIGFSFHSTPDELDEILKNHPEMEFVQLQINYLDWDSPSIQSKGVYEVARKHNKPIIIMEPVKGGLLANPPENVAKILKSADPDSSMASWALRFAAGLDGVITVLSGMSTIEQVKDNISYMKDFGGLSEKEKTVLAKAREELCKIPLISCTGCNYCTKVCPENIAIPASFSVINQLSLFGDPKKAKNHLKWQLERNKTNPPSDCIGCGACEKACPQHISIRNELAACAERLK